MADKPLFKPGEDNHRPGAYIQVGPKGGKVPGAKPIHIDQGDRLPPTFKPGNKWTPVGH